MPLGSYWPLLFGTEGERDGAFSEEFLDEAGRPSSEFYKLLRIELPPIIETLTFSPTSTELDDANTVEDPVSSTKHEAIANPPDTPNDNTYVRSVLSDTATEDRYGFESLPDDVVEVREVRVYARGSTGWEAGDIENDGPWSFALRVNGTNYNEDQLRPDRYYNLDYRTTLLQFSESPDTLEQWTVAEVNALEASVFTKPDGDGASNGQRYSQLWIEVDVATSRRGLFSSDAPNSRSEGVYQNRVMEWRPIRYSAEGFDIERVTTSVRVADPDNELGALFAGKDGEEARFSAADLRYASPNILDKTKCNIISTITIQMA